MITIETSTGACRRCKLNKKSNYKLKLLSVVVAAVALAVTLLAGCGKTAVSTLTQEDSDKQVIVAATRVAATGLGEALKNISGDSQRKDFIRNYIDPIRFMDDDSGYFFVYDYSYNNIAIGVFSDLQGQNLKDLKDSRGKYFIQEFAQTAKKGGGFVEYYWPHTVTKVDMRKISYISPIPGSDYFIGTGFYPDVPSATP
jgi:signal transduction histidine kinase